MFGPANAIIATKSFNWRGEHNGYQVGNSWIPLDQANTDARKLSEQIAAGSARVINPEFVNAVEIHDRKGNITGYDSDKGFVPCDPGNHLYQILKACIDANKCSVSKPQKSAPLSPSITHLIFCIAFQRPWPHLIGEFRRPWKYQSGEGAVEHDLEIKLGNIPAAPAGLFSAIISHLGVTDPIISHLAHVAPIQNGLLQIVIPVQSLRKLFKSERAIGFSWKHDFVEDQYQQSLVRNGRSPTEGPDILWLLSMAPSFLARVIVDVANSAATSFRREFGGQYVGYFNETLYEHRTIVFHRNQAEEIKLHHFSHSQPSAFQLSGNWLAIAPDRAIKSTNQLNANEAISQIRGLLEAGFPLEAISVANAFLEIIASLIAPALVKGDHLASDLVTRSGYARRRQIIRAAADAQASDYLREALEKYLDMAEKVYPKRNDYMHDLRSTEHDFYRTVDLERSASRLLHTILDHFFGQLLLSHLGSIITGTPHLTDAAVNAARTEASKLA